MTQAATPARTATAAITTMTRGRIAAIVAPAFEAHDLTGVPARARVRGRELGTPHMAHREGDTGMSVTSGVNERLAALTAAGTSVWLDQIRRSLIEQGELQR